MKLMKIEKVTSDAIVPNTEFFIDVDSIYDIVTGATTCVVTGAWGTLTFTVDGTDTAEKLLNASKISRYFADKVNEIQNQLPGTAAYNLITSYADFETATGIVFTGGTGPLVTTALS